MQVSMKNQLCKIKCLLKLCHFEKADLELIKFGMLIKQSCYELRPLLKIRYQLLKAFSDFKNQKIRGDILSLEDVITSLRLLVKEKYNNEVYLKAKLDYITAKVYKTLGFKLEAKSILV